MKKILFIATFAMGLVLSSCDSYLDINENPNSVSESNINTGMLMPAAEMNLASSYGCYLRITGGYFSEQYAHLFGTSNYVDYSQFQQSASRCSSTYTQLYQRALGNLETIRELAEGDEEWGTYLAATVLRAFTFQTLVDCFGEVPYTEALDADTYPDPVYDDGQTIYEGLLVELDDALSKASSSDDVCTNFLFQNENAANWIKFANALKLKLLMRMADVRSVQSEVAALIAEDNFPTEDVAYTDCWANESGSWSPYYGEEFSTGVQTNVAANLTVVGSMQILDDDGNIEYQDPRLTVFFNSNENDEYVGGISGTNYTGSSMGTAYWCRPNVEYDEPVSLITVAETEFFLAEYYARYGSATQAAAHYEAAIEASFSSAGVDGAAENIALYPYDNSNYKECIGDAKYIALSGVNNYEAWCEVRRLGYPAFGSATGDDYYMTASPYTYDVSDYVPFTLYTPISVFAQVGSNHLLQRFPYAESSSSRNSNVPTFPGYTSPVFWAE